jgi:hypothetical protein
MTTRATHWDAVTFNPAFSSPIAPEQNPCAIAGYTYFETLFLMYTKNKIQHLLSNDKSPFFFYSGHTQEQQNDFIWWVITNGPENNESDEFEINSIIEYLYKKTASHLNVFLSQFPNKNVLESNLRQQKVADELMHNLRSRDCHVLIFTREHMNLLNSLSTSLTSKFKV